MYSPPEENIEEFEESPFDEGIPAGSSGPADTLKTIFSDHGKTIAVILLVLIMGYFGYDYFIGSLVKVTIETKDTENKLLTSIPATLYEGDSQNVVKTFNGSLTMELRAGEYRIEYDTSGTKYEDPGVQYISVSSENKDSGQKKKVELEQNLGIEILNVQFPTTLVAGQTTRNAHVALENTSSKTKEAELVFEDGLELFNITTNPSTISIPGGTTSTIQLTVDVPSTVKIVDTRDGDEKDGKIRVKYTGESKGTSFILYKKFEFSVSPSTSTTIKANANELEEKRFTIKNKGPTASSEAIEVKISLRDSQNNNLNTVEKWFTWNIDPPFGPLGEDESIQAGMQFLAPVTADSDTITGEVRFYTSFWEKIVPFTIELKESEVEIEATLDNSAKKKYNLSKDEFGQYESKTATLKIENKGELDIETILYDLDNCDESYIQLVDPTFFPLYTIGANGKSNDTKSTQAIISAPFTALPGEEQFCQIRLTYLDPKSGDVAQIDPITVQINTG
jgi:hypothetical protein